MRIILSIFVFLVCAATGLSQSSPGIRGFRGLRLGTAPAAFSPTNFPNLFGWWKADALTNLVDGSSVVYWSDSSGHNLHMQPADGNSTHTPYFTNSFQNALPGTYFDGVNDYMTNACAMSQTNLIFVVLSTRANPNLTVLFDGRLALFSSETAYWSTSDKRSFCIGADTCNTPATILQTNTLMTITMQFAGTSSKVWTNGVFDVNTSIGTKGMDGGMTLGALQDLTFPFQGYILEMFCITNTFGTQGTVLQDGCNYLRAKYNHY